MNEDYGILCKMRKFLLGLFGFVAELGFMWDGKDSFGIVLRWSTNWKLEHCVLYR